MNRVFMCAVFALVYALTAIGEKPGSEWYQPAGSEKIKNTADLMNDYGIPITVKIGDNGLIKPADGFEDLYNEWLIYTPGAWNIQAALEQALIARNEVETLAENFSSSGVQVSVKIPNGEQQKFTIKYKKGSDENIQKTKEGIIIAEDGTTDIVSQSTDGRTVEYGAGTLKLLQIRNTPTTMNDIGKIPVLGEWKQDAKKGNGPAIKWEYQYEMADGGKGVSQANAIIGKSIEFRTEVSNQNKVREGGVQIAGFGNKSYTTVFNMADALTNKVYSGVDYSKYSVVLRDGSNANSPIIRYTDIGRVLASSAPKQTQSDNITIASNVWDDAGHSGTFAIKGAKEARSAANNVYMIPNFHSTEATELSWTRLADGDDAILDSSQFGMSNGKVKLKISGTDTDSARIIGAKKDGEEEGTASLETIMFDDKSVDNKNGSDNKQIGIKGWNSGASASGKSLSASLFGNEKDTSYKVLAWMDENSDVKYIDIGDPFHVEIKYDNSSTKTNDSGEVEVYGFSSASVNDGSLPYKYSDKLSWTSSGGDGALLQFYENKPQWFNKSENGYILTSLSSGLAWSGTASQNMYYGTGINGGLGWNMLPNVTTNSIEVDNATIKAVNQEGATMKVVSLYTSPGANGLYGAYMADGHLAWAQITIPTNIPSIVDNKSVNTNNAGAVQIYNWESLENGILCKDGDHPAITNVISKVTATNGIENVVRLNDRVGLAGWTSPQCATSIAAMLTSNAVDRAQHRVLCRRETANGVEMHYASIGKLVGIGCGALKFKGNYDATSVVVGSGDTTNTVTFAALDEGDNTSVKVKVESDGDNGVIIKLGAFYK